MRIHRSYLLLLPCLGSSFAPSAPKNILTLKTTLPSTLTLPGKSKKFLPVPRASLSPNVSNMSGETAAETEDTDEPVEVIVKYKTYTKWMTRATLMFPIWTVLFTGIALKDPSIFSWFTTKYFTRALTILMLSMGITLSPEDFVKVAARPKSVGLQFALCYGMMPVLALGLGKAFGMDPAMLAGMVLVGAINGGQSSNLCTYIANGNVALSVLMTTATTIGAIFMTPYISRGLLGANLPIDAKGIAMSTVQIVLAPIAVGMTAKKYFPRLVESQKVLPLAPVIGVVSTCLLVGSAVAQVADPIINAGLSLQLPVFLLHFIGGLLGYFLAQLSGFDEVTCRTMAIETSMKSSAFAFLLAKLHFGSYEARIPAAVSVIWTALTGACLSVVWRYIPVDPSAVDNTPPSRTKKLILKLIGKS